MIFRKTEFYYTHCFKLTPFSKVRDGSRRIKRVTYWILFIPIISISRVEEQKEFLIRYH